MRHKTARDAPWLRRIVAFTGAVGLLCLGSLAPATALTGPPTSSGAGGTAKASVTSAVTVPGPYMWNPRAKAYYPTRSAVTVSQTTDLTNQFVNVSWTGFTPSSNQGVPGGYNSNFTVYPVQVAECAGTNPATIMANCDGLTNAIQGPGKAGQTTEVDALTGKAVSATEGGSGSTSIQILTSVQDSDLGCSQKVACSLVVLPFDGGNYGPGKATNCQQHTLDSFQWAIASHVLSTLPEFTTCVWNDRIVIPLHFAPGQANCKFSSPDFTVAGSPMMQRAMTSWISKLCSGASPDRFVFTGTLNEPDARTNFLDGDDDVALTTEPADSPAEGRSYTYAPVGISATVVAYWMDNPQTGEPYTDLRLTARLVAKLVTESYNFEGFGCNKNDVKNPPPVGCDMAVYDNPEAIFTDPDFRQYNKITFANQGSEYYSDFPTVLSGNSDMTYEVTRWIADTPSAESFIEGTPDPWGMRVNTYYTGVKLPEEAFESQDQYPLWQGQFSPQFPLGRVDSYQADNTSPGVNPFDPQPCEPEPCTGNPTPNPYEQPGQRDLITIMDEADATADNFPTAALQNHAGNFVPPTLSSMAAAVNSMTATKSPEGTTLDDNESTKTANAYPLTMVVYAMVPTSNTSKTEARKIAQWLDYVAGPGEHQGIGIGQLPTGYLPLTSSMRKQTLKAAYDVLHQTGDKRSSGSHNPGGGNNGGSGGGSPKSSSSSSTKPGTSPSTSPTSPGKVNAAYSSPDADGLIRWVLPILIIAGALLALAGPSAIVLSRPGGRAAFVTGWRRVSKFTSRLGRKS